MGASPPPPPEEPPPHDEDEDVTEHDEDGCVWAAAAQPPDDTSSTPMFDMISGAGVMMGSPTSPTTMVTMMGQISPPPALLHTVFYPTQTERLMIEDKNPTNEQRDQNEIVIV